MPDDEGRDTDHRLVVALSSIVLTAVISILAITFLAILIDGGVIGDENVDEVRTGDEVVSVLGQIASAGVGALAGYFTARVVQLRGKDDELPPPDPS